MDMTNKHHILQAPLVVYSGGPQSQIGFLPSGTSLRYVETFAEGFDRFLVFVNVERSPLTLEEVVPQELVDPLSAISIEQSPDHSIFTIDELKKLLDGLGATKDDLQTLIESYED
jgi:hypothetical protein